MGPPAIQYYIRYRRRKLRYTRFFPQVKVEVEKMIWHTVKAKPA
jgi:hypothetical protein